MAANPLVVNGLNQLQARIDNHRQNNTSLTLCHLDWKIKTQRRSIFVIVNLVKYLSHVINDWNGQLVPLRELYYHLNNKDGEECLFIPPDVISKCLNRLANRLGVSRDDLPVEAGDKGYFYLSRDTTISINGILRYRQDLDGSQRKAVPLSFSSKSWTDITTTARVIFLIESHAMVARLLAEGFDDQFQNFISVNSAGYPTHSMKGFLSKLEEAENGNGGVGLPIHSFFDHDGPGYDIQLLYRFIAFGPYRLLRQQRIIDLTPLILPRHVIESLGVPFRKGDKNQRAFKWIPKRWELLGSIDDEIAEPDDFELDMWWAHLQEFINGGMVLPHSRMGNLIQWFVNDEEHRFDQFRVPNAPPPYLTDPPAVITFEVLHEPPYDEDAESDSEDEDNRQEEEEQQEEVEEADMD